MISIKTKMTRTLDKVVDYIQNNSGKLIRDSYANLIDPEDSTKYGNLRCSVGIFMTKEDIHNLANKQALLTCIEDFICWDTIKSKKIKELPKEFWSKIQRLNDSEDNWDEFGLSTLGEHKVDRIRYYIKNYKEV